jgi:hypothetical protein
MPRGNAPLYQNDRLFPALGTAGQEVLPMDEGRTSLIIQATGTGGVLLGFGKPPTAESLVIECGAPFQFATPPGDAIYAAATEGTIALLILAG